MVQTSYSGWRRCGSKKCCNLHDSVRVQGQNGEGGSAPRRLRLMQIGIIGLGYVGLPLVVAFGEAGHDVVGLDTDASKTESLSSGRSYVEDIPDSALSGIAERFRATTDYADLTNCDALIVCVPTPLTSSREPDLSFLRASAESISGILRPGQLVVLESTSYPGTTRDELTPILSRSGLTAGVDFHVAFSPERIDPGRTDYTVRTTPKLVGGLNADSTERTRALYAEICDTVVVLSSPEAAELSKLLENIFRSVNIALVNEMAQLCHRLGIDIWEVVEAAGTKPFGFMRFDPGPGMGGHCLPVDPFYLAFKARESDFYPEFIELAGKVNQAQPHFCVERTVEALNAVRKPVNGSRILLLGVSYKGGSGDVRESPALKIIELLRELGGDIAYHDPFVPALPAFGLESVELESGVAEADLVAIVTAHPGVDHDEVARSARLVLDLRGVIGDPLPDNVTRL